MKKTITKFVLFAACSTAIQAKAQWMEDATTIWTKKTNLNVGIGLSNPAAKLDIYNSTNLNTAAGSVTDITGFAGLTNSKSALKVQLYRHSDGLDWLSASTRLQAATDGAHQAYLEFNPKGAPAGLALGTASGNAVTVNANGNVGIGTLAPKALLNIKGGLGWVQNFNGDESTPAEANDWPYAGLCISGYDDFWIKTMLAFTLPKDGNYFMDNSVWNFRLVDIANKVKSDASVGLNLMGPGNLALGTSGNKKLFLLTNGVERLTVAENGNVGIGASIPSATLQVGSGTGNLHFGSIGILLKPNTGDRALVELHSPDGSNRLVLQSLSGASYLASLEAKPLLLQTSGGNVGIGTTNPTQKLSVNGTIQAKEIVVNTGWSDFVFDNNYKLRPLTEVEQFVKTNKHLPEIPSQKEVEKNGVPLGDISSKLLMKIEELTLYMIEMKKENEMQKAINESLKNEIKKLQNK